MPDSKASLSLTQCESSPRPQARIPNRHDSSTEEFGACLADLVSTPHDSMRCCDHSPSRFRHVPLNIRRERFGFYNTNNRRDRTPVLWRPESRGREHDRWFAFVSGNLGCFRAQGIFWLATAPARFLLVELGEGAGKAVGTFARLVARYGLKNVPTRIEIIAEPLACHAGAITYPRPATGRCAGGPPSSGPRVKTASVLDSNVTPAWGRLLVGDTPGRLMSSEAAFHVAGRCAGDRGRRNGKLKHAEAG